MTRQDRTVLDRWREHCAALPEGPDTDLAREVLDDLDDHYRSFDLRWDADMRAIKRWQAAHPGNDLVWPDHADLVVWLLEKLEEMKNA